MHERALARYADHVIEQSQWMKQVEANPGHSQWYIERFRQLAAAGEDIVGEADRKSVV